MSDPLEKMLTIVLVQQAIEIFNTIPQGSEREGGILMYNEKDGKTYAIRARVFRSETGTIRVDFSLQESEYTEPTKLRSVEDVKPTAA
jgi:hypothetical protein